MMRKFVIAVVLAAFSLSFASAQSEFDLLTHRLEGNDDRLVLSPDGLTGGIGEPGIEVAKVAGCPNCGERRGGETKTAPDIGRFARLGLAYVIAIVKLRLR